MSRSGLAASAKRAAHSVLRLDWIGRFGYAVRALLYILLGCLALKNAAGRGAGSAFQTLRDLPGGVILEFLAGTGLVCYGIFQIANGLLNLDRKPAGMKGFWHRAGRVGCGTAYAALGSIGLKLAVFGGGAGSGHASQKAAHTAMLFPGGASLVGLIGIGFAIAAVDQFAKAVTASFRKEMRGDVPEVVVAIGRTGFAAHAMLLAAVGWLIVKTGLQDRSRPLGVGPAIDALRAVHWLYVMIALGLIAFGIFSLLMAWYRDAADIDLLQRLAGKDG
jgi:hypothetical protein